MTGMRTDSEARRAIAPGDFVVSRCGRDGGRLFIVTGLCGSEYALIADGKFRKVEKPKKKKLKHVSPAGGNCPGYATLTNRMAAEEIKRFLAPGGGCIINI